MYLDTAYISTKFQPDWTSNMAARSFRFELLFTEAKFQNDTISRHVLLLLI
jgi:hypothetical protein